MGNILRYLQDLLSCIYLALQCDNIRSISESKNYRNFIVPICLVLSAFYVKAVEKHTPKVVIVSCEDANSFTYFMRFYKFFFP